MNIKNTILSLLTKIYLKRRKFTGKKIEQTKNQLIGILYTYENEKKNQAILNFIDHIVTMGHKVYTLCYTSNTTDHIPLFPLHTIAYCTIQHSGRIKHNFTKKFIQQPFDYLYCPNLNSDIATKYLIAKSKAICRVGYFTKKDMKLFDIMVTLHTTDTDQKYDHLIHQMCYITKQLPYK